MKDGTVGWNPGKQNPNILKPAGTIDPEVPVVFFESTDRKPLATYVNYAVHLDNVGEPLISADMPCDPEPLPGRLQGTGDGHAFHGRLLRRRQSHRRRLGRAAARLRQRRAHGHDPRRRGAAILAALAAGRAGGAPRQERDRPPGRSPSSATATRRRLARSSRASRIKRRRGPSFSRWSRRSRCATSPRAGPAAGGRGAGHRSGQRLAWVSLPGEIFIELGLAIKQDSPFPHTIIAELANGSIGYIPSRRAYAQGNYEVVSARCAEGSGERLVDAAVKLLTELHVAEKGGSDK